MLVERVLALTTTVVLAGTFPLAVVAAVGFRDAPFGSVLRPFPVVILAFVAMKAPTAVDADLPDAYFLVASLVATAGVLVSAAYALVLLTERRKL
ncbi:hypothetical protein [Halorussus litoreus]|uniref:hypothetical protein n=1 Tax=Halorussus litoreus TaxID=1710536 RepID=UPI000E24E589|nr:hypothetical protein [Halorussus litoreus]